MNDLSALTYIQIGEVELDNLMDWSDEFKHVGKVTVAERTLNGEMATQHFYPVAGRPITLVGGQTRGWQSRQTAALLKNMSELGGFSSFTVAFLDGSRNVLQSFVCRFRNEDAPSVDFDPVTVVDNPDPYFWYQGTIKLITIE